MRHLLSPPLPFERFKMRYFSKELRLIEEATCVEIVHINLPASPFSVDTEGVKPKVV